MNGLIHQHADFFDWDACDLGTESAYEKWIEILGVHMLEARRVYPGNRRRCDTGLGT